MDARANGSCTTRRGESVQLRYKTPKNFLHGITLDHVTSHSLWLAYAGPMSRPAADFNIKAQSSFGATFMASGPNELEVEMRRISWVRLAVALASLAVIAGLLFAPALAPWVLRFEHWTADWRTAYLSDRAKSPNSRIAVVLINEIGRASCRERVCLAV